MTELIALAVFATWAGLAVFVRVRGDRAERRRDWMLIDQRERATRALTPSRGTRHLAGEGVPATAPAIRAKGRPSTLAAVDTASPAAASTLDQVAHASRTHADSMPGERVWRSPGLVTPGGAR